MKFLLVLMIALLGFASIKAQDFAEEHARLMDLNEEFSLIAEPNMVMAKASLEQHHDIEYNNLNQVVYSFQRNLTDAYTSEMARFQQLWDSITDDISQCTDVKSTDLSAIYNEVWGSGSNKMYDYRANLNEVLTIAISTIEQDYQVKLIEVANLLNSSEATAEDLAEVMKFFLY